MHEYYSISIGAQPSTERWACYIRVVPVVPVVRVAERTGDGADEEDRRRAPDARKGILNGHSRARSRPQVL